MDGVFLPIFPEGSLDSSVITTVWVGIIVSGLLNLRLGWVMSGLVVPGYLVPLLLVKPWAALVVLGEAALTYLLVWVVFECIPRRGLWFSVFGRDRFFALLLGSVLVRLCCDVWLLPRVGAWLTDACGLAFDYRNNLHSFGLIIVALIANQFWKPGLRRGTVPLIVTVGVTFVIMRFVLMPFTNFSISSLSYAYEDIAASMLASPKAYIILIVSAYVASRMNLLYGWEYSGILLPSLLALVWYQPLKVAASLTEALAVLIIASLVLRAPVFKKKSIEGARKLILFATVSYGYKFVLSYVVLWLAPEQKVTDYFGFGYLLATLIAMKMHEKGAAARITRATLQTSLTAVLMASVLGFGLTFLPDPWTVRPPAVTQPEEGAARVTSQTLMDVVAEEHIRIYDTRTLDTFTPPLTQEIDAFSAAITILLDYLKGGAADQVLLAQAADLLRALNYEVSVVEDRYYCLTEMAPRRGWGFYVLNKSPSGRLVVETPAPLLEKGVVQAGTWVFIRSGARALAVAGGCGDPAGHAGADVLRNYQTLYHAFHRTVGRGDVLQVRCYTPASLRAILGRRTSRETISASDVESRLWVKSSLPPSLNLALLKQDIGACRIEWGKTPLDNIQRDGTVSGFAELMLNRRDMRRLLFEPVLSRQDLRLRVHEQRVDGFLQDWLLEKRDRIAATGSDAYMPARLEELLYFDEEVLSPLLRVAETEYGAGEWTDAGLEELRAAAASAAVSGYQIIRYRHQLTGQDYLILVERDDLPQRRYWGTYVFRLGQSNAYVIQIPRPLYEVNTFEYGVSLFERLQARAVLIAGTSPYANRDGSADVVQSANKCNLFALVNQVVLREAGDRPLLAVQTRAFGLREEGLVPNCDALLAFDDGASERAELSLLGQRLADRLEGDGLNVRLVDGSLDTAKYEVSRTMLSLYTEQAPSKEFTVVWLSPAVRVAYRQQTENVLEAFRFRAVGLPSIEADLYLHLLEEKTWADSAAVPAQLRSAIEQYVSTQDVVALQHIATAWPDYRFIRLIDRSSKQSFLDVYAPGNGLALVAGLSARAPHRTFQLSQDALARETVLDYVDTRGMWLELQPSASQGETS